MEVTSTGIFLPLPGLSVGGRPGRADNGAPNPPSVTCRPASPWEMGALQAQTFYTLINNLDMGCASLHATQSPEFVLHESRIQKCYVISDLLEMLQTESKPAMVSICRLMVFAVPVQSFEDRTYQHLICQLFLPPALFFLFQSRF